MLVIFFINASSCIYAVFIIIILYDSLCISVNLALLGNTFFIIVSIVCGREHEKIVYKVMFVTANSFVDQNDTRYFLLTNYLFSIVFGNIFYLVYWVFSLRTFTLPPHFFLICWASYISFYCTVFSYKALSASLFLCILLSLLSFYIIGFGIY